LIIGYILGTFSGLIISSRFFNFNVEKDVSLIFAAFRGILDLIRELFGENIDKILTQNFQIVFESEGDIFIAIFSKADFAEAGRIARKYAKIFADKFKGSDLSVVFDDIKKRVEDEIKALEREIVEVNKKILEIKYI